MIIQYSFVGNKEELLKYIQDEIDFQRSDFEEELRQDNE